MGAQAAFSLLPRSLGNRKEPVVCEPWVVDLTFANKPSQSPQAPGRLESGSTVAEVSREPGWPLGDAVGGVGGRVPLGGRFGCSLGLAVGAGLRGSGLAPAPGRRAYGLSQVTLRSPTFSGGGGNTHELFGDLIRPASGERPPRAHRFRRCVQLRVDSEPQGTGSTPAQLGWFLRNGFCLKCETIHSTKRNGVSHLFPFLRKSDLEPRRGAVGAHFLTTAGRLESCPRPPRFLSLISLEVLKASFAFMSVR